MFMKDQKADQHGENDCPRQGIFGVREELAQVNREQVGIGGGRGDLPEPEHPGGLNSHEASESDAGVEIGTAGLLKARRNFGEAADDHGHAGAGGEHGVRAVIAD